MIRQPAVAGRFYAEDPAELRRELDLIMIHGTAPERVIGIVAPHAGYVYSGAVAGTVYGQVTVPSAVICLCPNHTGLGASAALYPAGQWVTPLGAVPVNSRLSQLILKHAAPLVKEDEIAHRFEHSLEVQLPFLQHRNPAVTMAALCLGSFDYDGCRRIGEGIAKAVQEFGEEVLLVASSDMTHYESAQITRVKDDLALAQLLALDPEGLLAACRKEWISMCGAVPAAVMLVAAKILGASAASVNAYATSGDVTGDHRRVVGYAAVTVS